MHSDNTRFLETGSLNIKYSMTHQLKYSFSLDLVPEFGSVFFNSIRVLPKHKFKTSLKQFVLKQPLLTPSVKKVPSVS